MHLESVRDVKQCGAFDHTASSPSKWLPGVQKATQEYQKQI